jgi:hypothetical protein
MKTFANSILVIFVVIFFASSFLSCEKPESYSEVPEISFKSTRVFDSIISIGEKDTIRMVEIKFNFVDGDGDFGYDPQVPSDTIYKNNVVFGKYEKRNNVFVNVDSLLQDSTVFSIPNDDAFVRDGQNKTLKGYFKIHLNELVNKYDTIKYSIFIRDRARHKSNIIETSEITGIKSK